MNRAITIETLKVILKLIHFLNTELK